MTIDLLRELTVEFYEMNGFDLRRRLGAWRAAGPCLVTWSTSVRGEIAFGRLGGRPLVSLNQRVVTLPRARYLIFARLLAPRILSAAGVAGDHDRQLAAMLALPDEQIDEAVRASTDETALAKHFLLPRSLVALRIAERTNRPTAVYVPNRWAVARGEPVLPTTPAALAELDAMRTIRIRRATFTEEPFGPKMLAA